MFFRLLLKTQSAGTISLALIRRQRRRCSARSRQFALQRLHKLHGLQLLLLRDLQLALQLRRRLAVLRGGRERILRA